MIKRLRLVSAVPPFQAATTYLQFPEKSYWAVCGGHTNWRAESGTETHPGVGGILRLELSRRMNGTRGMANNSDSVLTTISRITGTEPEKFFFINTRFSEIAMVF
jgi:hypothetical protein